MAAPFYSNLTTQTESTAGLCVCVAHCTTSVVLCVLHLYSCPFSVGQSVVNCSSHSVHSLVVSGVGLRSIA